MIIVVCFNWKSGAADDVVSVIWVVVAALAPAADVIVTISACLSMSSQPTATSLVLLVPFGLWGSRPPWCQHR